MEEESGRLTRKEILAMAKIFLESRAFAKEELHTILDKLIDACPQSGRQVVEDLVRNEAFCYVPPRHGRKLLDALWDISLFIKKERNHPPSLPAAGRSRKAAHREAGGPPFFLNSISIW